MIHSHHSTMHPSHINVSQPPPQHIQQQSHVNQPTQQRSVFAFRYRSLYTYFAIENPNPPNIISFRSHDVAKDFLISTDCAQSICETIILSPTSKIFVNTEQRPVECRRQISFSSTARPVISYQTYSLPVRFRNSRNP